MEVQKSVDEVKAGQDDPFLDFHQMHNEASYSCCKTLSLRSSDSYTQDQNKTSLLLLGGHLDYS